MCDEVEIQLLEAVTCDAPLDVALEKSRPVGTPRSERCGSLLVDAVFEIMD